MWGLMNLVNISNVSIDVDQYFVNCTVIIVKGNPIYLYDVSWSGSITQNKGAYVSTTY